MYMLVHMSLPYEPVPTSAVDDLLRRLASTRQAQLPTGTEWGRGTDADFLAGLLRCWRDRFDWRRHEQRILNLPWKTVGAGDRALRTVHIPGASDAPTVVLLHGWPDSVLRFERLLPLLDDLNVVVPALPGFPFANEVTTPGMTVVVMAELIADAVQALGINRYVVSGGDVGADVAEHLANIYPDRVLALHLTNVSPLHAVFADRSTLDAEGLAYLDAAAAWQRAEGGYIAQQSTKPNSLAPALADSPAGLAAWMVEKLMSWSHVPFGEDDLLTWVSIYWFTNTIGSSFAPYVEFAMPVEYVHTPTVLSAFAHDTKLAPRAFASRFVNVREYIAHETGGHFAAWEQPALYAQDLRRAIQLVSGPSG
jgi:pimeloyl-ACP methyl ester carboxylesterase